MTPKHTDTSDYFAQIREPRIRNADNKWLGSPRPICGVDEVNGPGAAEVTGFIPTRHELLELARYWANVAVDIEYCWFCYETVGSTDMRLNSFAWRRVSRIHEVLGDAVSKVVDEVYQEYGKKQNPQFWNAFLNGTGEQLKRTGDGFLIDPGSPPAT
jgi:hypothetical protein